MNFFFLIFFLIMLVIIITPAKKVSTAVNRLKRVQIVGNSQLTTDEIKKQQLFFKQNKMGWIMKTQTVTTIFVVVILVAVGFVIRDYFNESNAIFYMGFIGIIVSVLYLTNIFTTLKSYKIRSEYVKANPGNPLKIFVEPQQFIDDYRTALTRVLILVLIMSAAAFVWGLM